MKNIIKEDKNITSVLNDDAIKTIELKKFENLSSINIDEIMEKMGPAPWATRVVYNKDFAGVLICQNPGEGNRKHYHPDADECWVILEGSWEWYIEGKGEKQVGINDIVLVQEGTPHQITCVGDSPGIRFAITAPDVSHNYYEKGGSKNGNQV